MDTDSVLSKRIHTYAVVEAEKLGSCIMDRRFYIKQGMMECLTEKKTIKNQQGEK